MATVVEITRIYSRHISFINTGKYFLFYCTKAYLELNFKNAMILIRRVI